MEKKQLQKNLGAAAALSTVVGMVIGCLLYTSRCV